NTFFVRDFDCIQVLDVTTQKKIRQLLQTDRSRLGHSRQDWTCPMSLSPDGKTLALCGLDNAVEFVDVAQGHNPAASVDHNEPVRWIQFTPDGKILWTDALEKQLH